MPTSALGSTAPRLPLDFSNAVLISPRDLSGPAAKAIDLFAEEVEKRTRLNLPRAHAWPDDDTPVIAIGPQSAIGEFCGVHANVIAAEEADPRAEGFRIRTLSSNGRPCILIIGDDERGVLFGVGRLLRTLRMTRNALQLTAPLNLTAAPHYALRGHQLGYRDKTNSYCGWDLPQWEQYIRDLVVFGANAIELIPPRSDDNADSVHFPLAPLDMMVGMSQLAADYGVDVWLWFPAMDETYDDSATVEFALQEWNQVFTRLPRIDAVFVPGGDPGRTQPNALMGLLEKQAAQLRQTHPTAQMWVSPQGFSDAWMDEFVTYLTEREPNWLDGVVHGPWVHMTMAQFRALIPDRYPIRNYPDITHSLNCQFPVPDWDVAYAVTEGRETINPRPLDEKTIFHYSQPHTIGFLTYSEGCNDDVNKAVWSGLGWDPSADVVEILREYGRYFIGDRYAESFAQGLLALERNWRGPLMANTGVQTTLQLFQALEDAASPHELKNWRFQQALYRAYYDAYVHTRLIYESALEERAMSALREARRLGSLLAMAEAERILDLARTAPIAADWRTRIFQLAEALFQSIHMQLSVKLYRAQHETRGANLDGIDFPLNNGPWLKERFVALRALPHEEDRLAGIQEIVDWTNPGPNGFYDDLSNSLQQSHLVPGPGYADDPAFLESPLRNYPYIKDARTLRRAWRCYTIALKDAPLRMHYPQLDPTARYRLRVVYSGTNARIPVRLETDGGVLIHDFMEKPDLPQPVEFDVPVEATQAGSLTLRWTRPAGLGGAGRGCDVSEVWLMQVEAP